MCWQHAFSALFLALSVSKHSIYLPSFAFEYIETCIAFLSSGLNPYRCVNNFFYILCCWSLTQKGCLGEFGDITFLRIYNPVQKWRHCLVAMVSLGGRDLASLCGAVCPVWPERVLHALTVGHQAGKLFCKHTAHLSLQLAIVRLKHLRNEPLWHCHLPRAYKEPTSHEHSSSMYNTTASLA